MAFNDSAWRGEQGASVIGRGETCASVIGRELLWVGCDINKYLLIIVSWGLIISGAFQVHLRWSLWWQDSSSLSKHWSSWVTRRTHTHTLPSLTCIAQIMGTRINNIQVYPNSNWSWTLGVQFVAGMDYLTSQPVILVSCEWHLSACQVRHVLMGFPCQIPCEKNHWSGKLKWVSHLRCS